MLTREEQIKLGAKLLKLSFEEAQEYTLDIDNSQAIYISVPIKGRASLIVGEDGNVLYANSSVSYNEHLEEYNKGRRTPIEAFKEE